MGSWCMKLSKYMGGWCQRKLNSMGGWVKIKVPSSSPRCFFSGIALSKSFERKFVFLSLSISLDIYFG